MKNKTFLRKENLFDHQYSALDCDTSTFQVTQWQAKIKRFSGVFILSP